MQIRYSPHAVDRMVEREISTADVKAILTSPDGMIRQSMDKCIFYRRIEGRKDNSVAVVAIERNQEFEIVTDMINFEGKP